MIEMASFLQRCSIVKRIPVFSSLHWFHIQSIARKSELVHYKKGDLVSRRGNQPDFVYFLASGRLESYSLDSDGRKDGVEFIHRGMFFGIISALTGEAHSETFEAINDSVILRIPVPQFKVILKKNPDLGIKFSKILSQRIRSKVTKTDLVRKSSIISIYSPVAGSGGSTYALNLALSLYNETKDRVVWVSIRSDKPPQHQIFSDLDEVRPKWKTEPRNLAEIVHDTEAIPEIILKTDLGIDLLNVVFDSQDKQLVGHISQFVASFIDQYRYIIVDLPSDMDDIVMKTLSQSDLIYLVMARKREVLDVGRAVLDRLEENLRETFNEEKVSVVIGGVSSHRSMSEETVKSILDYDVLAFLPHIQTKDLAMHMDTPVISFWAISSLSQYSKMITRISRRISGVSVGLVLGGGAAFGLSHIGVIKVLEEEGIPIDVIVGSSMGALIGGLWAAGYKSSDLEKMALEFKKKSNLVKLIDLVFPLSGLISGKAIMAWLRSKYGEKTFRDTRIPLKIVAYDLLHRKDLVIEEGSLVDAVRKSISIPGVFQPIVTEDQLIIDGGVMNPLPVNVLVGDDVKRIIAVNVLQSAQDVINGYQKTQNELKKSLEIPFLADPWIFIETRFKFWINKTFFPNISDIIVRTLEASEAVIADQSARQADIVIHPDLSGLNWFELYNADVLIARGEAAAKKHIERIKDIIKKKS
ncbi:MAG: patatin-like phospholipase family protein [Candidatus Omnitrophica bacterium]|nr:patatin-like phospholipase family protein [Candidatus Omnitrophota bacterium]